MRHPIAAVLLLLGLGLGGPGGLGACSGDDGEEQPPASKFGYETPDKFPRQDCQPGSLAGLSPAAIYHGVATGTGRAVTLSSRIDRSSDASSGALTGKVFGTAANRVAKTDDDLLVRAESADQLLAVHWCGRLPSGELVGSYVTCSARGCDVARLVGNQVVPLEEPAAHNLTLLGGSSPQAWGPAPFAVNVRVAGGLAYVARYHSGLSIVDVRDPAAMVHLGELPVEFPPSEIYNDVKVVDGPGGKRYALMASNVAGVVVVDVTEPRSPHIAGHFGSGPGDATPNVHTIAIDGGRAYLANTRTGLDIFDLSQLPTATLLGHFTHPAQTGFLHDLHVAGDRAYLNWWEAGMAIVDVSTPAAPRLVGNFENYGEKTSHSSWVLQAGARKIALHGDEQYGAHLNLVDVDEASPTFARSIASWMTRPEVSIHNVMAMGHFAVIAYYQDGVRVLDLSEPTRPEPVAWFNTWGGPTAADTGSLFYEAVTGVDVDAATSIIYVADLSRGLLALRLASGI